MLKTAEQIIISEITGSILLSFNPPLNICEDEKLIINEWYTDHIMKSWVISVCIRDQIIIHQTLTAHLLTT